MIAGVWGEFTDWNVTKWTGSTMLYQHNIASGTVALLLANNQGNCDSWAELFVHALGVQGVASGVATKTLIKPISDDGFIVDSGRWDWGTAYTTEPVAGFGYVESEFEVYSETNINNVGSYTLRSQGDGTPSTRFNHHAVVVINGQIYDPSYGVK